jgi:hypothetical protein
LESFLPTTSVSDTVKGKARTKAEHDEVRREALFRCLTKTQAVRHRCANYSLGVAAPGSPAAIIGLWKKLRICSAATSRRAVAQQ